MARMAGSVGAVRTIGVSLALGLLGCGGSGSVPPYICPPGPGGGDPKRLACRTKRKGVRETGSRAASGTAALSGFAGSAVMSCPMRARRARRRGWTNSGRRPGISSVGARYSRISAPGPMTLGALLVRAFPPSGQLHSAHRRVGASDGLSDSQSGCHLRWGKMSDHRDSGSIRGSAAGGAGRSKSTDSYLVRWSASSWVSSGAVIIRGGTATLGRGGRPQQNPALTCARIGPDASRCREVKVEMDPSTHPHQPNGGAGPAQKDYSCHPAFWPNRYL